MPYTLPGTFVDGSTTVPVGAQNLNEIVAAVTDIDTRVTNTTTTANAAVPKSTATAKGDLLIASASGVITRIAVGPDAQILTADSTTGTGVKWGPPTSGGTGIPASTVTAKADLIVATANATVSRLGVGTDGQVLTAASGTGTGLSWATPAGGGGAVTSVAGRTGAVVLAAADVSGVVPVAAYNAKGALLSASAASSISQLLPGTTGQVLTVNPAATLGIDWETPTGGSGAVTSVAGRTGAVTLTSADVGLGNVNNTSDANKPVSTAQATADALAIQKSLLTTKGDIIAYDGTSTAPARVAVGLDGQVLTASSVGSSRGVVWQTFNTITGTAAITSGAGAPNTVRTGSVGDLYLRTDGGASSTLYVKESGAATNTGWVAK